MRTLILAIAIVKKGDAILMRKKPAGSPPYAETWYLFGGLLGEESSPEAAALADVLARTGITAAVTERLSWDTEVKPDKDGIPALHIYLDCLAEYVSGDLTPAEGIERLEWIPIDRLAEYDIVPPSREVFRRLGYLS